MNKICFFIILLIQLFLLANGSTCQVFAEALGKINVTNLHDSGPGSLRECVGAAYARQCIFKVSGVIQLAKTLRIRSPHLQIQGSSAPAPGITLRGAGIQVETHDVSIENIQVRVGDDPEGPDPQSRDGVSIGSDKTPVYNVLLDHLSISWAIDENVGVWFPTTRDITISNCIISEALNDSIHPKGPHSKGILIGDGVKRVSISNNLIAHNFERNPYFKPGASGEFNNNVVYNWGNRGAYNIANVSDSAGVNEPVHINFIGNVFKAGPNSFIGAPLYGKPIAMGTKLYVHDNIGPSKGPFTTIVDPAVFASSPIIPVISKEPIRSATETLEHVLSHAGANPKNRNATDQRVIEEVRTGSGAIKDCLKGCSQAAEK